MNIVKNFKSKIKAIAVDFDGVIANSQTLHFKAWEMTLEHFNLKTSLKEEDIIGKSVFEFTKRINLTNEEVFAISNKKQEFAIELAFKQPPPLYPTVKSTLIKLSSRFPLSLVSSGEKEIIIKTLNHYNIKDIFKFLILEDNYASPKPSPEPYLKCLELLRLCGNRVLAIEDSESGIQSAISAGLITAAIPNTTNRNKLREANIIIEKFEDLISYFSI